MAYTVLTSALKARILDMADMTGTSYISDTMMLAYINKAYAAFYDLITKADPLNYMSVTPTTVTFSSSSNTPSLPADYYRMVGVDVQSGGDWVPIRSFNFGERGYSTTTVNGTARIWYIPTPAVFTNFTTDSVNGIAGWEEYIVLSAAISCLMKEESSTTAQERDLARIEARIGTLAASRDAGSPKRVTSADLVPYDLESRFLKYCIIGDKIMFVSEVQWR